MASTGATSLTILLKFSRFQNVKKMRLGKRFSKCLAAPPALPLTGLLQTICNCKFSYNDIIFQIDPK